MEKVIRCIGELPPPYGGVTVKCELLAQEIRKYHLVEMIDLMKCKHKVYHLPSAILKILKAFIKSERILYMLDSKHLQQMLNIQRLFPHSLEDTVIIAMGGKFHEKILNNCSLSTTCRQVRSIWVETEEMKASLEQCSFSNVRVFPNPKSSEGCCPPRERKSGAPIRLVFFSQISREKGVADIMELVKLLDQDGTIPYTLDFYGHVVPDFKEEFEAFLPISGHVRYCGVFDSAKDNVYQKLNEYDVLLFPTRWEGEGVPGILVEAKMAGLAVIASRQNYNAELVREDLQEGILLNDQYAEEMFQAIGLLSKQSDKLQTIKNASYESRIRFTIEHYSDFFENI